MVRVPHDTEPSSVSLECCALAATGQKRAATPVYMLAARRVAVRAAAAAMTSYAATNERARSEP